MGRKKKHETEEKFVDRKELMKKRGLSEKFIREQLKSVEYDLGHRTKRYKISEVDQFLAQRKAG